MCNIVQLWNISPIINAVFDHDNLFPFLVIQIQPLVIGTEYIAGATGTYQHAKQEEKNFFLVNFCKLL